MQLPKLLPGHKRQWVKCIDCGNVAFYDYVPHSLSNPIMVAPCGHGVTGRFHDTHRAISAQEAKNSISKNSTEMG